MSILLNTCVISEPIKPAPTRNIADFKPFEVEIVDPWTSKRVFSQDLIWVP